MSDKKNLHGHIEFSHPKTSDQDKLIAHIMLLSYDFVCDENGLTALRIVRKQMDDQMLTPDGKLTPDGMIRDSEAKWILKRFVELLRDEDKNTAFGWILMNYYTPLLHWNDVQTLCYQVLGYIGDPLQRGAHEWRKKLIASDHLLKALKFANVTKLASMFS